MAIWMLLQISLQFFTPIAVLHGIPERQIERVWYSGRCQIWRTPGRGHG
jgi:hypothetical protein